MEMFWFLIFVSYRDAPEKISWGRLLANLVDRRNWASRCASLVSTNWKALWMLPFYSPSNQYYLYLWAFLDSCDVWALPGSSQGLLSLFWWARLNYLAILYLELFGNLPTISQVWRAKERKMRLCRWAVANTLKMCWPKTSY
jgi:hypothetical protein